MQAEEIDKIRLKVENVYKSIAGINTEKRRLNDAVSSHEQNLREIRKECPHPPEFVTKTPTDHVKQCSVCQDLIIY